MLKDFDITGKRVLITGAGRGIGKGIALVMAEAGADVVVTSLGGDTAAQVGREVEALGRKGFGWAADAVALQASDFGKLKVRITMFEDGGRLFGLTAMAPLDLWDIWVVPLGLCLNTFELLKPKGQSAPLGPKYSDDEPKKDS